MLKNIENLNDGKDILSRIKSHLTNNQLPQALEILVAWAKLHIAESQEYRALFNDILALSARFNQLQQEAQLGIISAENYALQTKQLTNAILEIVDALESGKIRREEPSQPKASAPSLIRILTGIITAPVALVTAPVILAAQSVKNIKSALTPARIGKIVYESPSRMQLNTTAYVTVRISQKSLKEAILKEGLDAAKTKEGELEISDEMEVALFEAEGQQNFDISPWNHAEQVLNKRSYTQWRFSLDAKRVGEFSLILRVSMKVHLPELGEKKRDIVTWSTSIEVDVDGALQMEKIALKDISWNATFKKQLKEKIAQNEFGSVFQNLANHLSIRDTELFNDLVTLETWFNNVGRSQQLGTISYENYTLDFQHIAQCLINLIDRVGSPRKETTRNVYKEEIEKIRQVYLS